MKLFHWVSFKHGRSEKETLFSISLHWLGWYDDKKSMVLGEESVSKLPLTITYCGPKLEVFILQRREDLVSDVYDVLLLEGYFL